MRLTLSTLRCPDSVAPETRATGGGEFSIGRGPDNAWVLPDPDRHLSKRHCVLAFRSGGWQIADTSTNGTYLNRESTPIGQGQVRDINDGDRIRLGAYEIELRIEEEAAPPPHLHAAPRGAANPFDEDPFAPPAAPPPPPAASWRDESALLPADFDPFAPSEPEQFPGSSLSDHSASVSDAFRPPAVSTPGRTPDGLPADWDLDEPLLPPSSPPAAPFPPPAATSFPPPAATPFAPPPPAPPPPAGPAAFAPPPAASPFSAPEPDPFAPPTPPAAAPAPAAFAPPSASPPAAASPFEEPPPVAPRAAAMPPAFAPPAAAMVPPAVPAAPPPAAAPVADGAALAAFLRGAGVPGARIEDPAATMEALGAAFRALVSGLRSVLIARAAIKGEFRIEQTMIRARGNNPLKFSADDDDALAALLGTGRRTNMGPAEAVAEALRDMKLHELASVAAMQSAVRELLAQLSPEAAQAQAGGALLPMQKKARAFEAYEVQHAALVRALADDFDSAFGKAFARAYEKALAEAAARPED